MEKVVIIGGGASGLVAAVNAKTSLNDVIILERNNSCGKKILITGNGKCNYWNEDQNIKHYHSNNQELLEKIINSNSREVLEFFSSLGIIPKIKNGYYYPFSNQATSIKNALILEAKKKNITIKTDFLVETIQKEENKFIISSKKEAIISDKLVLATGSAAAPKTGSDGMGYSFARRLGHKIIKPLPALVQLKTKGKFLKDWQGIRTDVKLSLYENSNLIKEEEGEIQLTDYGVSGICIFNLSRYVSIGLNNNKKEVIKINFLPFLNISDKKFWLKERNNQVKNRTIEELLEGILNYKLVRVILKKSDINTNKTYIELSENEKNRLIENLTEFELEITGTNSFDQAQVCSGGIPLNEININNMSSYKNNNLYIIGELLDVDGECGGYNLGFAWVSGLLAGIDINDKN